MPTQPPSTAQGYMSEYMGWGTALTEVVETVPDLIWPSSIQTYAKMRTDPQLTAVLNAYTLPLRQAPKYVDPAGCKDEVVSLIADDLGLPVLGKENKPGPARRRGIDFDEHFRVSLLNLVFGHMPFAQKYEIRDNKARLVELAERMPSTITDILITDEGKLDGILQFGEKQIIPARNLVWYAHEREGAAWQGRSMLRSAYGAWLLKHDAWRVLATSNRRWGTGVSTVNAPAGATQNQIDQATLLASAARSGEQAGVGLPHGFTHTIAGISGSVPDTLGFIRYLDGQMAQMALASVLNLDASPNGSRALGDTFVNLMLTSLNAIAKEMSSVLTALAMQMVDYNFGEDENVPRIVIGDAGSRPEVTAEAIVALLNAGAITYDPELERWARERWAMPERDDVEDGPAGPDPRNLVEMVQKVYLGVGTVLTAKEARGILNQAGANLTGDGPVPEDSPPALNPGPTEVVPRDPGTAPPPGPEPVAARSRALRAAQSTDRRELNQIEAAAQVDPESIDTQWTSAVDDLVKNWDKYSKAQRQELSEQIQAAVTDDKVDALAELAVDSQASAQALAHAMHAMSREAAKEMKREAKAQGVSVSGEDIDDERLSLTATAVAAIVASGLANSAGREAIRVWTPGSSADDVAAAVDDHVKGLSDSYLRDQLGAALSGAQNAGRQAVMSAAPPAKYFASEILDTNTCTKCRAVDGQQFTDVDQAEQAYASGGYTLCEGKLRCRGIVVAVWDD